MSFATATTWAFVTVSVLTGLWALITFDGFWKAALIFVMVVAMLAHIIWWSARYMAVFA